MVMRIFIGADHRGFKLKQALKGWLSDFGHDVVDCGAEEHVEGDDYTDYATKVASQVVRNSGVQELQTFGVVICGSGVGVDVVANKFAGIRCGLGLNAEQVRVAREDDDINVLALAADYVSKDKAEEMVKVFLESEFSGEERHVRRLEKISELESNK